MIALTSISPNHKNLDSQLQAVESWVNHGYSVVSLNHEDEIEELSAFTEKVKFIPTKRTNEVLFKRKYVLLSAFIDFIKESKEEEFLIVNSDIIIEDQLKFTHEIKRISKEGVVVMIRSDFNDSLSSSKVFDSGFDGFFINKKWASIFPQSVLCMGQCHWDFWLPYICILSGVKIFKLNEPYLFHKRHTLQYNTEDWKATGEIFRAEVGRLDKELIKLKTIDQVSNYAYRKIKSNLK